MKLTKKQLLELQGNGATVLGLAEENQEQKPNEELAVLIRIASQLDKLSNKEFPQQQFPDINPVVNVPEPKVNVTVQAPEVIVQRQEPITSWLLTNIIRDARGLIKEVTIIAS